jgi:prolyl-tRNA synthetase
MIHGDDKGAVFPPRVAEYQVALLPVGLTAKTTDEDRAKLLDTLQGIEKTLTDKDIRVLCDTRSHYSPGWKYAEYELRGFPLRIEFGPKDAAKGTVLTVRRDTGEKGSLQLDGIAESVQKLLDQIQEEMLVRARKMYHDHIKYTSDWQEVVPLLNAKNVIRMPHCGNGDCAEAVKKETAEICKTENEDPRAPSMGAKGKLLYSLHCAVLTPFTALCVPFEQKDLPENALCTRPGCGKKAVNYTQFGRSY